MRREDVHGLAVDPGVGPHQAFGDSLDSCQDEDLGEWSSFPALEMSLLLGVLVFILALPAAFRHGLHHEHTVDSRADRNFHSCM